MYAYCRGDWGGRGRALKSSPKKEERHWGGKRDAPGERDGSKVLLRLLSKTRARRKRNPDSSEEKGVGKKKEREREKAIE